MTADEVLTAARTALPEVSLATVYNTLNELVALGEVLEHVHPDGRKRYDPNVASRHHHLVCDGCGRMYDVALPAEPTLPAGQRHGFDVRDVAVTFSGRCPDCTGA